MFLCPPLLRVQLFLMDFHLPWCLPFLLFVSIALASLSLPCHIKIIPITLWPKTMSWWKSSKCYNWVGGNQASRTNRTKTHYSLFFVPQKTQQSVLSPSSLLYPNADFKNIFESIGFSWFYWCFKFDFKIILTDVSKFYKICLKLASISKREVKVGVGMVRTGQ